MPLLNSNFHQQKYSKNFIVWRRIKIWWRVPCQAIGLTEYPTSTKTMLMHSDYQIVINITWRSNNSICFGSKSGLEIKILTRSGTSLICVTSMAGFNTCLPSPSTEHPSVWWAILISFLYHTPWGMTGGSGDLFWLHNFEVIFTWVFYKLKGTMAIFSLLS